MNRKNNFIKKAKQKHDNKYDYSNVEYVNNETKVCIICPEHGEFWQTPHYHLKGYGCPKCNGKIIDNDSFINKAKQIHSNRYDYSKIEYKKSIVKVCIICPEHGEFWQTPHEHLSGHGCPECAKIRVADKRRLTTDEFIKRAKSVHGNKYDYSKVEYLNEQTPICIICPEHGEFWQTPRDHVLKKHGCRKCAKNEILTTDEFIKRAKSVHGNKYDYSKVEYKRSNKKICVVCIKHGEFWITPNNLLRGKGCSKCQESNLERLTRIFLETNSFKYEYQKRFDWLGKQSLDFYLPDYNIAIECQGEQHFKPIAFGCQDNEKVLKRFKHIQFLDEKKLNLCTKNEILIFYINYNDDIDKKLQELLNLLNNKK